MGNKPGKGGRTKSSKKLSFSRTSNMFQEQQSNDSTSEPRASLGSALADNIDSTTGKMLSDAIRIAIQRAHDVDDKMKLDEENYNLRLSLGTAGEGVLDEESYNYKEQFVDKNATAAKSESPIATDYSPAPFINIRTMFGVTKQSYETSLCDSPLQGAGAGAGASGSVFFLSADNRYVIKSLPKSEADKLRAILRSYHQHMSKHNESLLPKFFGLYKLKLGKRWVRVVVMSNAFFTPLEVHQKYDLKGSTVNRSVSEKKQAAAAAEGDIAVLKDSDLSKAIWLTEKQRDDLLGQTHRDGQFLCSHGIMDYSLLLGIHNGAGGEGGEGGEGEQEEKGVDGGNNSETAGKETATTTQTDSEGRWHSYHGGFKAYTGLRQDAENLEPAVIYIAIIDVLQQWNNGKRAENFLKTKILIPMKKGKANFDSDISAQNPYKYLDRFTAMARGLLEVFTDQSPRKNEDWVPLEDKKAVKKAVLSSNGTEASEDEEDDIFSMKSPWDKKT